MTVVAEELDGLLPSGVRLEPCRDGYGGNRWRCDCGDRSTYVSGSVEYLLVDYRRHLNMKHRRR